MRGGAGFCAVVLAAMGCAPSAPADGESFISGYAHAICTAAAAECAPAPILGLPHTDCETYVNDWYQEHEFALLRQAIAAGRIVSHPELVPACLAAVAAGPAVGDLPIYLFAPHPAECARALEGQIGVGGTCSIDYECAPGLHCSAGGVACGQCLPWANEGDPCDSSVHLCSFGLVCEPTTATCSRGRPRLAACTVGDPLCGVGLGCTRGACHTFGDRFTEPLGASCLWSDGRLCAPPLVCGSSGCEMPVGTPGGPCVPAYPDPCLPNGSCVDIGSGPMCQPLVALGEICDTHTRLGSPGYLLECAGDARCGGRCMTQGHDGAPCTGRGDCWSQNCDLSTHTCVPPTLCPG